LCLKVCAGGVHDQLWQKMPVETNRRIARVDYPGNVGENDSALLSNPNWHPRPFGCNRGPVAQLGARFHGMEEVVGSIPTRSTNSLNNLDRRVLLATAFVSWFVSEPAVLADHRPVSRSH
jgi:hypothetical protein